MVWNSEQGYYDFKIALADLMRRLGIGLTDFTVRTELAPYLTRIIQYLDKKLIDLGDDADIREKIQVILDAYEWGADMIVSLNGKELAEEIGIITEIDNDNEGEILDWEEDDDRILDNDMGDSDSIQYYQDRFIFCWTDVTSSLATRLRIQYASLLMETDDGSCYCCCGAAESWRDWEEYSSGVYPEDEEYTRREISQSTTSWTTANNIGGKCGCSYRRL